MAVRTSTLVLIGAGGGAFLLADTLPIAPAQRAAVKFGGLALGILGAFRLLEDLKASGGLLGATVGALVPFGPAEERVTSNVTVPESAPPSGLSPAQVEEQAAEVRAERAGSTEGLALGGLSSSVIAWIAKPAENEEASRSLFSSTVELEVELENATDARTSALVEVVAFFERLFGNDRRRSTLGTFELAPRERRRVKFDWDTGDRHTGLFETGAANVSAELLVNGRTVSSTLFKVR